MPQSTTQAWASPSRMMASMQRPLGMAGGWWPDEDVTLPQPVVVGAAATPIRFDDLVDHLSQPSCTARATPTLLRGLLPGRSASPASEKITRDHGVVQWDMPRLLTTFLDSPAPTPGDRHDDATTLTRDELLPRVRRAVAPRLPHRRRSRWPARARSSARACVTRLGAAAPAPGRTLVVVLSLRGAADGLSLVVPHARPAYYQRPAAHRRPRRPAARQGRHVRPAPATSRRCCRCGTPASSPPSTPPGCRRPTARTSRRWRRSRTPIPGSTQRASAGSTG